MPPNARVIDRLPYGAVLPFAGAFVSNAGYGAFGNAIMTGVPTVLPVRPGTGWRWRCAQSGQALRTILIHSAQLNVNVVGFTSWLNCSRRRQRQHIPLAVQRRIILTHSGAFPALACATFL